MSAKPSYPTDMSAVETLEKRILFNEAGEPEEVMIPYQRFVEFIEAHGLDLTDEELESIAEARLDLQSGNATAFISHDELVRELGCTE